MSAQIPFLVLEFFLGAGAGHSPALPSTWICHWENTSLTYFKLPDICNGCTFRVKLLEMQVIFAPQVAGAARFQISLSYLAHICRDIWTSRQTTYSIVVICNGTISTHLPKPFVSFCVEWLFMYLVYTSLCHPTFETVKGGGGISKRTVS